MKKYIVTKRAHPHFGETFTIDIPDGEPRTGLIDGKYGDYLAEDVRELRPLSYSSLKAFAQSPAHYIAYLNKKFEQTPAMVFGSLVDNMLFTPEKVQTDFIHESNKPAAPTLKSCEEQFGKALGRSKWEELKQAQAKWIIENANKPVIGDADLTQAQEVIASVMRTEKAAQIINSAKSFQEKLEWTDPETGLAMVAKLDITSPGKITDFKTAATAIPEVCGATAFKYDYHLQAGVYLDGWRATGHDDFPDYWFIFAEKEEPFAVSVHKCDSDFVKLGKKEFHRLLVEFKYCLDNNLWHKSYDFRSPMGYFNIELPFYAKKKLE